MFESPAIAWFASIRIDISIIVSITSIHQEPCSNYQSYLWASFLSWVVVVLVNYYYCYDLCFQNQIRHHMLTLQLRHHQSLHQQTLHDSSQGTLVRDTHTF